MERTLKAEGTSVELCSLSRGLSFGIRQIESIQFCRIRDGGGAGRPPPPPPPIVFEGRNLLQQTIYHWKGNLSKSPIHFRYRQNILISRLYDQFSRNDSGMAPEKNFKRLKYEHIIYSFEARV